MKIKLTFIALLATIASTLFISCSTNDDSPVKMESLNTFENRQAILNFLEDKKEQEKVFKELGIENPSLKREESEPFTQENLNDYMDCSICPAEYKEFLYPMFQEFLTLEDSQIIDRINFYESKINSYNSDELTKDNLRFTLFLFKSTAQYNIENQEVNRTILSREEDCCGRAIAQGLVSGFVAGCVQGAYVGATVGTVTVPVLGTTVGAVGGCIFSGAVGAVVSATAAGFWEWLNS